MIQGLDHTSFTVSDMDKSIAFYRDLLDMTVAWDSAEAGVRFRGAEADKVTGCPGTEQRLVFMTLGDRMIEFIQYTPTGKPLLDNKPSDTGSAHVGFRTDNIHELYHKLLVNGIRIHSSPQRIGPGWCMYFRDPDGIILEAVS